MKTIFSFCILLVAISINAQEKTIWSLDDCINYALDNNISLKRQALSTELNKKDFSQSKLNALPNLNGQFNQDFGAGRVLDRGTYQWLNTDVSQGDLGLMSNVTLFKGFQGYNSIKMAEANYFASKANLELFENNLLIQIMTGYLDLLRKEELYEIAIEKTRITELQVERMIRLNEVGNVSNGEVLEVKAQASTEKYNATVAKNSVEVASLALRHLLNLSTEESFEIARPEISDPTILQIPKMSVVYEKALGILPQIKSAEHNITYYQKNISFSRGALSPELFVRALYYSNYSDKLINPRELDFFNPVLDYPVPQQVFDNQYKQVSFGLNIPIFNKWQNKTNISKAKLNLLDARYNLDDTKQQLLKDIQQYYTDASAAFDNYQAAGETMANSEEAYRFSEEKFKVGMATALELEEARNRLFTARAEMISAKYVFAFYVKVLEFYQGNAISFQ